jgi:hypothetical protein
MKKLCALVAAAIVALPSQAAILTLENVTANGPDDFTFGYQATLGPDEGLRTGDQFVIFDFLGYVDGSIFSGSGDFAVSAQNTSPGTIVTPGQNDDPNIANLVFTYTGPGFRTSNGSPAAFDFPLFGARSRFSGLGLDAFFSLTTKNNPDAERNHPLYMLGSITVPRPLAVPEPATWAMMIGGLGLAGAALRRRTTAVRFGQA